jgi:hypothetical protein
MCDLHFQSPSLKFLAPQNCRLPISGTGRPFPREFSKRSDRTINLTRQNITFCMDGSRHADWALKTADCTSVPLKVERCGSGCIQSDPLEGAKQRSGATPTFESSEPPGDQVELKAVQRKMTLVDSSSRDSSIGTRFSKRPVQQGRMPLRCHRDIKGSYTSF